MFAQKDYNVCVFSRTKKRVEYALSELSKESKNRIYAEIVDVLDDKNIEDFCSNVSSEFGEIDILINNVGGGGRWGNESVLKTSQKTWEEVQKKNCET